MRLVDSAKIIEDKICDADVLKTSADLKNRINKTLRIYRAFVNFLLNRKEDEINISELNKEIQKLIREDPEKFKIKNLQFLRKYAPDLIDDVTRTKWIELLNRPKTTWEREFKRWGEIVLLCSKIKKECSQNQVWDDNKLTSKVHQAIVKLIDLWCNKLKEIGEDPQSLRKYFRRRHQIERFDCPFLLVHGVSGVLQVNIKRNAYNIMKKDISRIRDSITDLAIEKCCKRVMTWDIP